MFLRLLPLFTLGLFSFGAIAAEPELAGAYAETRAEATRLAGKSMDMPKRAAILYSIYVDSKGNHEFPLVALHGALWGYRFFEATGPIGDAISYRYFYDRKEMAKKKAMLKEFSLSFQKTNRSVFIDTYTNYAFSKAHGTEPGAEEFVHPKLLAALNRVHAANVAGELLSQAERKEIFETALLYEQELTVGPSVRAAVDAFHCPVLEFLTLRPIVHFAYFPEGERFFFRDFSDQAERIRRAVAAYDLAVSAGWDKVVESMQDYGVAID